jgi:outer membrane protein OmpA-like peptidoglycan-associated protein
MNQLKPLLLFLLACTFAATGLIAQETDDDSSSDDERYKNIRKRDYQQMDDYITGDYLFPPKPKNNMAIGIKVGAAFVQGDIPSGPGGNIALDIRKALGHAFSLRLQANIARMHGLEYRPRTGYQTASATAQNPWRAAGYQTSSYQGVFENYETRTGDLSLQAVVNLNNINFYKEQVKWNVYAFAGIGVIGYSSKTDALDADGDPYVFGENGNVSTALSYDQLFQSLGDHRSTKNNIRDELDNILDGTYESHAEAYTDRGVIDIGGDRFLVDPLFTGGLGVRYRLSRRIEVEAEYRLGILFSDLLDGVRWTEQGDLSPNWDNLNQATIGIHFRIGKGEESLWWSNPMTESYKAAAETRNIAARLQDDTDDDGVPDLYDKEPDTPEGYMVDAAGRTLDTDGDGVPDTKDDEPYSPKGAAVDGNGVALDSDGDGVPDIFDKEPTTPSGSQVDARGVTINTITEERVREIITETGGVGGDCLLPMIHFDLDKDNIKPDFYPQLYYIAQVMRANPSVTVTAVGHTDVRAADDYNYSLSERRVNNAVDFIVNTYGIDRSRFNTSFKGENENIIRELPANYRNRKLEPLHYINRRVEFVCN